MPRLQVILEDSDLSLVELVRQAGVGAAVMTMLVVGLVEVVKKAGLPTRWAPFASLAIGLGLSLSYELSTLEHSPQDWWLAMTTGLIAGLMGSGLYSTARSLLAPEEEEVKQELSPVIKARVKQKRLEKHGDPS